MKKFKQILKEAKRPRPQNIEREKEIVVPPHLQPLYDEHYDRLADRGGLSHEQIHREVLKKLGLFENHTPEPAYLIPPDTIRNYKEPKIKPAYLIPPDIIRNYKEPKIKPSPISPTEISLDQIIRDGKRPKPGELVPLNKFGPDGKLLPPQQKPEGNSKPKPVIPSWMNQTPSGYPEATPPTNPADKPKTPNEEFDQIFMRNITQKSRPVHK